MEGSITPQQIDIGAIISAKWGRSVPHFVVRLVERLIHQQEINEILRDHGHLQGVAFMWVLFMRSVCHKTNVLFSSLITL